jgi:hypothetical protein
MLSPYLSIPLSGNQYNLFIISSPNMSRVPTHRMILYCFCNLELDQWLSRINFREKRKKEKKRQESLCTWYCLWYCTEHATFVLLFLGYRIGNADYSRFNVCSDQELVIQLLNVVLCWRMLMQSRWSQFFSRLFPGEWEPCGRVDLSHLSIRLCT